LKHAEMKTLKVGGDSQNVIVTLNRPEVRNAFNTEMIAELTAFFRGLDQETQLETVELAGDGKAFCAGGDLNWMKSMVDFSLEENRLDAMKLYEMFDAISNCPVPLLTRVHGHVMGGGLGLVACGDIVAAESQTQFCFSEVRIGLVPSVISAFVTRRMQASRYRRYMLTGEVFGADAALESGLVHFIGSQDRCEEFLNSQKTLIQNNGKAAVKDTKSLVDFIDQSPNDEKIKARAIEVISQRRVSVEGQEGLAAFLEKRRPSWQK